MGTCILLVQSNNDHVTIYIVKQDSYNINGNAKAKKNSLMHYDTTIQFLKKVKKYI